MPATLEMKFDRRPSTFAYMLRAFHRSAGLRNTGGFPPVCASWRQYRVDPRRLSLFLRLSGLRADPALPLIYPHVFGFPLQMAILTHPAFPLPIWHSLQIRNHLLQHRPIGVNAVLDLETRVAGQRILEKGAEVDLHTSVCSRNELLWESLTTFYYRGRFGEPGAPSPLARAPAVPDHALAQWHTATGLGWRLGGLTGDYNPIHWSHRWARRFGFKHAFHHPQLVLGKCMTHLPARDPAAAQRLDAWLKGPVFYDSDVRLRASMEPNRTAFALIGPGEERPAILGSWYGPSAAERRLL